MVSFLVVFGSGSAWTFDWYHYYPNDLYYRPIGVWLFTILIKTLSRFRHPNTRPINKPASVLTAISLSAGPQKFCSSLISNFWYFSLNKVSAKAYYVSRYNKFPLSSPLGNIAHRQSETLTFFQEECGKFQNLFQKFRLLLSIYPYIHVFDAWPWGIIQDRYQPAGCSIPRYRRIPVCGGYDGGSYTTHHHHEPMSRKVFMCKRGGKAGQILTRHLPYTIRPLDLARLVTESARAICPLSNSPLLGYDRG